MESAQQFCVSASYQLLPKGRVLRDRPDGANVEYLVVEYLVRAVLVATVSSVVSRNSPIPHVMPSVAVIQIVAAVVGR